MLEAMKWTLFSLKGYENILFNELSLILLNSQHIMCFNIIHNFQIELRELPRTLHLVSMSWTGMYLVFTSKVLSIECHVWNQLV